MQTEPPVPGDETFMHEALRIARRAVSAGELPCAAVLVDAAGDVIGGEHARDRAAGNRVSHAELLLLLKSPLRDRDGGNLTLYSTLEPCIMCTGALLIEGIGRVVYGLAAPTDGGVYLTQDIRAVRRCGGHTPRVTGGVLAEHCRELFRAYAALSSAPPGMAAFARDVAGARDEEPGGPRERN